MTRRLHSTSSICIFPLLFNYFQTKNFGFRRRFKYFKKFELRSLLSYKIQPSDNQQTVKHFTNFLLAVELSFINVHHPCFIQHSGLLWCSKEIQINISFLKNLSKKSFTVSDSALMQSIIVQNLKISRTYGQTSALNFFNIHLPCFVQLFSDKYFGFYGQFKWFQKSGLKSLL